MGLLNEILGDSAGASLVTIWSSSALIMLNVVLVVAIVASARDLSIGVTRGFIIGMTGVLGGGGSSTKGLLISGALICGLSIVIAGAWAEIGPNLNWTSGSVTRGGSGIVVFITGIFILVLSYSYDAMTLACTFSLFIAA